MEWKSTEQKALKKEYFSMSERFFCISSSSPFRERDEQVEEKWFWGKSRQHSSAVKIYIKWTKFSNKSEFPSPLFPRSNKISHNARVHSNLQTSEIRFAIRHSLSAIVSQKLLNLKFIKAEFSDCFKFLLWIVFSTTFR